MNCQECEEPTLATQVVDAPWGRVDLCERHYDQAGERGASRDDYDAVGINEFCARAAADKARTR